MKKNICMKSDFHCHTTYSDGANTIDEMINAAIDIGLKTIAITDHVRKDSKWIPDYLREIEYLKNKYRNKINILSGIEAKVINIYGDLDVRDEWYDLVDIILGSIHSIPSNEGFFSEELHEEKSSVLDYWLKAIKGLMKNKRVNIIAHPFSLLKVYDKEVKKDLENKFLSLARRENKIIELSLRHLVPSNELIKRLVEEKINLVIGSDAHSVEELYLYHEQKKRFYII